MFGQRSTSTETTTETVKGPSLARGPAWIVGSVLAVFGLLMFSQAPGSPLSTSGFPDGVATGESFLGFEVNAWTAWLTTAAGVFVLIGAAQHLAARTFSLIAGLALGAMAVIALFDGSDVLGLAAANGWDALGWGVAAAILLVTALLPRKQHERTIARTEQDRIADRDRARLAERDSSVRNDRDRDLRPERDNDAPADGRTAESSPPAVTYGDHNRTADGMPVGEEHVSGSGVRSEPLRRTYDGTGQTDAERAAEADRTRTR